MKYGTRSTMALALALSLGWIQEVSAQRFDPAHSTNYSRGRGGAQIDRIVLHTIEGSAETGIGRFKDSRSGVSAHYVVDVDGTVTQMVRDSDRAFHVRGHNRTTIGIEHAGYAGRARWSDAQLRASANLVRQLSDRYGIPVDRRGIVSHAELDPTRRSDPGLNFPWEKYLSLVRGSPGPDLALRDGMARGTSLDPVPRQRPASTTTPRRRTRRGGGQAESAPQQGSRSRSDSGPRRPRRTPEQVQADAARPRPTPGQEPRPATTPRRGAGAGNSTLPASAPGESARPSRSPDPVGDDGAPGSSDIPLLSADERLRVVELQTARSMLESAGDTPELRKVLGELTRLAAIPTLAEEGLALYGAARAQGSDLENGKPFVYEGKRYTWVLRGAWPVPVAAGRRYEPR